MTKRCPYNTYTCTDMGLSRDTPYRKDICEQWRPSAVLIIHIHVQIWGWHVTPHTVRASASSDDQALSLYTCGVDTWHPIYCKDICEQWWPSAVLIIHIHVQIWDWHVRLKDGTYNATRWYYNISLTLHYIGLILGLRPASERRRYKVTPSLICWAQT